VFRMGSWVNKIDSCDDNATFCLLRKFKSGRIGVSNSIYVLIYGITIGRYNYKVIKQRIFFRDAPRIHIRCYKKIDN
jgi:hypothetical protein